MMRSGSRQHLDGAPAEPGPQGEVHILAVREILLVHPAEVQVVASTHREGGPGDTRPSAGSACETGCP